MNGQAEGARSAGKQAESASLPDQAPRESARASRPLAAPGSRAVDDGEAQLERRIVEAELAGRSAVADVLARQLDALRAGKDTGNVVPLNATRRGRR